MTAPWQSGKSRLYQKFSPSWTWKIHSMVNFPNIWPRLVGLGGRNFQRVKKRKILVRFSTPVAFDALWFQNEGIVGNTSTLSNDNWTSLVSDAFWPAVVEFRVTQSISFKVKRVYIASCVTVEGFEMKLAQISLLITWVDTLSGHWWKGFQDQRSKVR